MNPPPPSPASDPLAGAPSATGDWLAFCFRLGSCGGRGGGSDALRLIGARSIGLGGDGAFGLYNGRNEAAAGGARSSQSGPQASESEGGGGGHTQLI